MMIYILIYWQLYKYPRRNVNPTSIDLDRMEWEFFEVCLLWVGTCKCYFCEFKFVLKINYI